MSSSWISSTNPQHNDSKNNTWNSEYGVIINWVTPPNEKRFFLKHRFISHREFSKSVPQRKKSLFRYRWSRSLNFDTIGLIEQHSYHKSSNSSSESSSPNANKSRDLSRSAKIMRALSLNHKSSVYGNESIKRSLTFDSTPSPKKSSRSSLLGASLPKLSDVLRLDESSSDSFVSNMLIASPESIDENQNQTPQQNRKLAKISNNNTSNTKESVNKSDSPGSTSLLRSGLKERIDNIRYNAQTPYFSGRINRLGYGMIASTPRNLLREFSEDTNNRPCTPENVIHSIPESISAIKKSHKKERLYYLGEQSLTREMEVSIRNENLPTKSTMESLGINNMSTSSGYNTVSTNQLQKKNTNIRKTLIYNLDDELHNTESTSDHIVDREATSRKIDSSDCGIYEENMQDSILSSSSNYSDKEDHANRGDKEECSPFLQKKSSNVCNIDVMKQSSRAISLESLESNLTNPQDIIEAVTPENSFESIQHIDQYIESIKKSHKKIKHENRKALHKSKLFCDVVQDIQDSDNQCENIESKPMDSGCILSPQNSDRPSTPENVNSSRLLLSHFSSIKKSYRKGKRDNNKRHISFAKYYDKHHEYRRKSISPSKNVRYEEKNKNIYRNESLQFKSSSPNVSPNKKKKSVDVFLQNAHRTPYSTSKSFLECRDTDEEFKIHTPIRRRMSSTLVSATNCANEISSAKDELIQAISEDIDFSRCATPVNLRRSGCFMQKKCDDIENVENDIYMVSDNKSVDTIDLTGKNGRSTPIDMSTTELLCNIESIKKSHKKDKHAHSTYKRQILKKKQSKYTEETGNMSSSNSSNMSEEHIIPSSDLNLDVDNHCTETAAYSNLHNEDNKCYEKAIYDDSQPSTSGINDNIKTKGNIEKLKSSVSTPPNCWNAMNFIKLLHTTSIKKSHKKERSRNAQSKYILMDKEHDLSDDGSIFDEEDRLTSIKSLDSYQNNDNEKTYS